MSREKLKREEEKIRKELTVKNLRRRLELAVYAPYYILKQVRSRLILLGSMFLTLWDKIRGWPHVTGCLSLLGRL